MPAGALSADIIDADIDEPENGFASPFSFSNLGLTDDVTVYQGPDLDSIRATPPTTIPANTDHYLCLGQHGGQVLRRPDDTASAVWNRSFPGIPLVSIGGDGPSLLAEDRQVGRGLMPWMELDRHMVVPVTRKIVETSMMRNSLDCTLVFHRLPFVTTLSLQVHCKSAVDVTGMVLQRTPVV